MKVGQVRGETRQLAGFDEGRGLLERRTACLGSPAELRLYSVCLRRFELR